MKGKTDNFRMNAEQQRILISVLKKRDSSLLENLMRQRLTSEELLRICDLLSDELVENGLTEEDEPTHYGQLIEEIIGAVTSKKIENYG